VTLKENALSLTSIYQHIRFVLYIIYIYNFHLPIQWLKNTHTHIHTNTHTHIEFRRTWSSVRFSILEHLIFRKISNFSVNLTFKTVRPIYRTCITLPSRCCILYIFSTNTSTEYFKHAAHSPFFSSKCRLFHNAKCFCSCIIHILHTGCAKI
jgi:hypothetical protein